MAIVFPASPNINETFTEGSITYKCVQTNPKKWIGLGVTPADRLVEGSNSLEINASNNLIWTGNNVGIGTDTPDYNLSIGDGSSYVIQNLRAKNDEFCEFRFGDPEGVAQGKITYDNGTDSLRFTTNGDGEKLRITSTGQLLIHHDTNVAPDGYESMLQLADDSYQGSSTVWKRAAGSSAGANPALILQKVRGADINGQGAVSDSDSIGQIRFYGADGTTAIECGNISATVDNTTSTNNVPGKLVFKTAKLQAGSGSPVNPTQAMTIKANHNVEIHDGNIVFETAGTGIDFSNAADIATGETVGGSVLNDYEEGTFVPTVSVEGQGSNAVTDKAYGRYVKVGKMVTVWCYVQLNGTPSGRGQSNAWQHGGLPFKKMSNASGFDIPGSMLYWTLDDAGNLAGTRPYMLVPRIFNNTFGGRIRAHSSDSNQSGQNASLLLKDNTEYSYTFTYETE